MNKTLFRIIDTASPIDQWICIDGTLNKVATEQNPFFETESRWIANAVFDQARRKQFPTSLKIVGWTPQAPGLEEANQLCQAKSP